MLKELIDKQRNYTNHFFEFFNLEEVEKLVNILMLTKGIIFFSGVGKSGLIAKKIAFSMASTGTKALFLSPIDALHGDIGMVSGQDVFILFSKSGESDELIQLAPAIRNKGAAVVAIVCNDQSRLGSICDHTFILPFQGELCPFDMAPTMSTIYQLLLGDLLTIALMRQKKFSLDEYALNHPSGRIGKRMVFKVQDLMITGPRIPLGHPEDKIGELLIELTNKRCGCLLITDQNLKLIGIFTDGDLRRSLQKYGGSVLDIPIGELMTKNVKTISAFELAWDAMKKMEADPQQRFNSLAVIDQEDRVVGLIHLHDIIQMGL
jgi:arabinose-5-phosphate isomerase